MTHTITPETIIERITDWRDQRSVDREQRTIGNVALAGCASRNGYTYTTTALKDALPLYENKPVFLDHPPDRSRARDRSTRDLAGSVVNVRFDEGRVRGDIRVLDTESGRTLLALVEDEVPGVGMSHVVLAERSADGKTVERIHEVLSVDVVLNPATTKTFQESISPGFRSLPAKSTPEDVSSLLAEVGHLRTERQLLESRMQDFAQQLTELQSSLHIQHLIDASRLPRDVITPEFREQLQQLPDDQSRRRLLHARAQVFVEQRTPTRSAERVSGNSPGAVEDQFLAALKRKV